MKRDYPKKVRKGDPILARDWNILLDVVRENDIREGQGGINVKKGYTGTTLSFTGTTRQQLALTSSTITARSGTTAGSGTVTPQTFDGTSISGAGQDVTVYLFSASASIASGKYCWIDQDAGGYWWIIAVEC